MANIDRNAIVFYDDECMMCSSFIRFVIRFDDNDIFRFCELSRIGEFIDVHSDNTSIIVKSDVSLFYESKAIFFILKNLKFPISVLSFFSVIPRFITDGIYRIISKYRKKILKNKSCPMWNDYERKKLL